MATNGAFANPIPCSPLIDPSSATTPANSTRSASCARATSAASSGSTMMLTWMLPSPAWPKQRNPQPELAGADAIDEREQFRDPSLRHDDVVIELERRDHLQRQRELAAHAPQLLRARASSRARRTSVAPASRHACSTRSASSSTAAGDAVHFDQQDGAGAFRRERAHVEVARDGVERIAVDQLERGRHDARADDVRSPPRPPPRRPRNVARSVACTGGFGTSRRMIFVMIASVPSDPTSSCVRS